MELLSRVLSSRPEKQVSYVPIASAPLDQQLFRAALCNFGICFSHTSPLPHNVSRLRAHSSLNIIRVDVVKPDICP